MNYMEVVVAVILYLEVEMIYVYIINAMRIKIVIVT